MAKITVQVTRGVEVVTTECDEGDTVKALINSGHLRGVNVTTMVAQPGQIPTPVSVGTPLRDGDQVSQAPAQAKLG